MRIYTGGTFDILHAGHINFLRQCKLLAGPTGQVIVSLNTDEFVEAYKGKGCVMTYQERRDLLMGCRYVDEVVANIGGADSKPSIIFVRPDAIAIGSDWARKDYYKQMQFTQDWLDEKDIMLIYIPYTDGISTTNLKSRIRNLT